MSKLLICDSEEGIRESLKLILSDFFELVIISDSTQCTEIIKNTPDIQIVLLDIKIPKSSGLQILSDLKTKFPNVNVIIISDPKNAATAAEAVRLGASGYIIKPFRSDEILSTVRKNLSEKDTELG